MSRENKELAGLAGVGRTKNCRNGWSREYKELQDLLKKGGQGTAGLTGVASTRNYTIGCSREEKLQYWLE